MAGDHRDPRAAAVRNRFLQVFGGPELPVPVDAIAEDLLGLAVAERELDVSGVLVPAQRRIWLKADEPAERKRFTLAHELGHWVCQCLEGRGEDVMCRAADLADAATRANEREANIFAAELLMPEDAVRAAWAGEESVEACAGTFGVSGEAMGWRLFNLGLVEERPIS